MTDLDCQTNLELGFAQYSGNARRWVESPSYERPGVVLRNEAQVDLLKEAGGWSSPAMPLRYAEGEIANEGMVLGRL